MPHYCTSGSEDAGSLFCNLGVLSHPFKSTHGYGKFKNPRACRGVCGREDTFLYAAAVHMRRSRIGDSAGALPVVLQPADRSDAYCKSELNPDPHLHGDTLLALGHILLDG